MEWANVRIDFHPAATAELEVSIDWYASQSATAARDFCVAVDVVAEWHPKQTACGILPYWVQIPSGVSNSSGRLINSHFSYQVTRIEVGGASSSSRK